MSKYTVGSIDATVGSSLIKGNSTDFNTYAAQGYLFKLNAEAVYYEIADITNATNMNLTSKYSNSDYNTGSTLNSLAYSIVTDYTTNYGLPELKKSDTGITYTYTKAIREMDKILYNASVYTVTSASDIKVTASRRGIILYSTNSVPWRLTVSNAGILTTASNPS